MKARKLPISDRYITRQFKKNIRGNIIRGIVELLTNSYESYKRLEEKDKKIIKDKTIRISLKLPKTSDGRKKLIVIDNAEGMDDKSLNDIIEYGKATSGILEGMPMRGYFGIGLKDTCYSLGNGEIKTIKNKSWYSTKFYYDEHGTPMVLGPEDYTPSTQDLKDIPEGKNGTKIIINIDANIKIPSFRNFKEKILNNVCLRDIFIDENCSILLNYSKYSRVELKWTRNWDKAEDLQNITENILYEGNKIPVDVKIFKASTDLEWISNLESERGLIIRSNNSIHEITLFSRQSHINLRRIYGVVTIPYLDELLKNQEEIITQSRDGLEWNHPFCVKLQERLVEIIDEIDLNEQRKNISESNLDDITRKHLKNLSKLFREIFRTELEKDDLPEVRKKIRLASPIENLPDFGFIKTKIKIYKERPIKIEFYVKLNKDVKINNVIDFQFDEEFLDVNPEGTRIIRNKVSKGYFKQTVSITGKNLGSTILTAISEKNISVIEIIIIDLKYIEFGFNRNQINVPIGSSKKVRLFLQPSKNKSELEIVFNNNHKGITISPKSIISADMKELYEDQSYSDLEIIVSDVCLENEQGEITASIKGTKKETTLKVVSVREDINKDFFKPDINIDEPNPELPVELNNLFGKIIIFARHNTVYNFWKDDLNRIRSTNFKLRVADLFIDKLIDVLIKRKFSKSNKIRFEDYENEKRILYRKYAFKIFKTLGLL